MAKWSLSSDDLVKIVLPSLRHVAELMGASVFLAVGTGSGNKFVYSSGYLKEVYEHGNLRPSSSDIYLTHKTTESCQRVHDENGTSHGESEEAPPRKRHRKSRKYRKRDRSRSKSSEREVAAPGGDESTIPRELSSADRTISFRCVPKRCDRREVKSHYTGCNGDTVEYDADGQTYALHLTFPSKEDARRAFLATPRILYELHSDYRKSASVSLQVRAASLPENLEPYEPPSLSVLVWTDDSVEKWELLEQMTTFGIVVAARKCPNLTSCYVVAFAKIASAEEAVSTFNTSFPSTSCVVLGYYKIGLLSLLWIGDIPNDVTQPDLEDICRKNFIKFEFILFNADTREAMIKLARAKEAASAKRQLIDSLRSHGEKNVFIDFVEKEHVDYFKNLITPTTILGLHVRASS